MSSTFLIIVSRSEIPNVDCSLNPELTSLLDTNVIIPNRHNPCSHPKHSIDVGTYRRGMTGPWVSLCLSDPGLMQGIYLASCQDLATKHRKTGTMKEAEFYEERALQYRGECLRSMYEAMPSDGEPVTDNVIGMVLFLAFNEVSVFSVPQT